jgi:hypothetical protein
VSRIRSEERLTEAGISARLALFSRQFIAAAPLKRQNGLRDVRLSGANCRKFKEIGVVG